MSVKVRRDVQFPPVKTVEDLLNLSDSEFKFIVDEDIRDRAPASVAALLRNERVVPRWYNVLLRAKKSLEGQFGAERKKFANFMIKNGKKQLTAQVVAERERYTSWKANALRLHSGLEMKLIEARTLRFNSGEEFLREELTRLRRAVLTHKSRIPAEDATPDDLALWDSI